MPVGLDDPVVGTHELRARVATDRAELVIDVEDRAVAVGDTHDRVLIGGEMLPLALVDAVTQPRNQPGRLIGDAGISDGRKRKQGLQLGQELQRPDHLARRLVDGGPVTTHGRGPRNIGCAVERCRVARRSTHRITR